MRRVGLTVMMFSVLALAAGVATAQTVVTHAAAASLAATSLGHWYHHGYYYGYGPAVVVAPAPVVVAPPVAVPAYAAPVYPAPTYSAYPPYGYYYSRPGVYIGGPRIGVGIRF
jgi:hypothetical protein